VRANVKARDKRQNSTKMVLIHRRGSLASQVAVLERS
jgi:hypothetical protein